MALNWGYNPLILTFDPNFLGHPTIYTRFFKMWPCLRPWDLHLGNRKVTLKKLVYGGFLKWWYLQIIHFNRVFHYKPSILGYPYLRKHPYTSQGKQTPQTHCKSYGFLASNNSTSSKGQFHPRPRRCVRGRTWSHRDLPEVLSGELVTVPSRELTYPTKPEKENDLQIYLGMGIC